MRFSHVIAPITSNTPSYNLAVSLQKLKIYTNITDTYIKVRSKWHMKTRKHSSVQSLVNSLSINLKI